MASTLDEVLSKLPKNIPPLQGDPQQSDALGINSKNFLLNTVNGAYVLKRWSDQAFPRDVQNTLGIMAWLAAKKLPVPAPVEVCPNSFSLSIGTSTWSLFTFVEGVYFSGAGDELPTAAEACGRLMDVLPLLPAVCMPSEGPVHMTAADGAVLKRMQVVSRTWDSLLGEEYAELLATWWSVLTTEWDKLSMTGLVGGRTQAAHFDLHPHNLLMNGGKVAAILDFEACKVMPIGFALGFAALKQCRQAMTLRPLLSDPRLVGSSYAEHLQRACPYASELIPHLGHFAVAEVMRRICIILRLNLENGDRKWNKVLPVQLGHLGEARELFG